MKKETLVQKIEAIKTAMNSEVEKYKGLANARRANGLDKYRELQAEKIELEKQLQDLEVIQEVEKRNAFEREVEACIAWVKGFEGNYTLAAGGHTKKFKTFLETNPTKLHVYVKQYSYGSDINFTNGSGCAHSIFIEKLQETEYKANILDPAVVLDARRKHNEILEELKAVQSKLDANYLIATGNHKIMVGTRGKEYTF